MRWAGVAGSVGLVACAAAPAPAPVAVPAPVDVAQIPAPPAPDTSALKAKAEEAIALAATKLHDAGEICGREWLETSVACPASDFAPIATDYQGYYAERPDARKEEGAYYSLPRLGGPTRTVEQVTADLVEGCEDACRAARNASIGSAVDDAALGCMKAKSGFASCEALEKRLAKNVRASEVERWVSTCEARCDADRAAASYRAEIDRKRPKTPADRARCEAACHKAHDGGWCGTGLLECLSECAPKRASVP